SPRGVGSTRNSAPRLLLTALRGDGGNGRSLVERFDAAPVDVVAGAAVGRVGAGAAGEGVFAGAAEQQIIAGVAVERVVALAADEDVVVVAAVERQLDTVVRQGGRADDVVAAQGVDRQGIVGRLSVRDRDDDRRAGERHGPRAAGNAHDVHRDRAVDGDGVDGVVSGPVDAEVDVHVGD